MKRVTLASAAALLALSVTAQGAMFDVNWTHTLYTQSTGDIVFAYDQGSVYQIVIPDPQNPVGLNGGEIVNGTVLVGEVIQFTIPNFYDPEPIKNIIVEFNGSNPSAFGTDLPFVMDIIGGDSEFGVPSPALPVYGQLVDGTKTPTQVTEFWTMQPNPDFETVKVFVPVGFQLDTIEIWTESVPEPASMALLGLGGLVIAARRRRRA